MKKLALLFAFAFVGCCTVPEPDAVRQERVFLDIVKPREIKYTQADTTLSVAQKQDVLDFLAAYESWLANRERMLAEDK